MGARIALRLVSQQLHRVCEGRVLALHTEHDGPYSRNVAKVVRFFKREPYFPSTGFSSYITCLKSLRS